MGDKISWEHLVAATWVAAAMCDSNYLDVEKEKIEEGLKKLFARKDPAKLRAEGERLYKTTSLEDLAKDLKRGSREDRLQVVRWVWRVVYADCVRNYMETSFSMRFPAMIGIEDKAALQTRDKIRAECGS